jgi:beta-lactamase regulating signal transducer with metallopeptidase domain
MADYPTNSANPTVLMNGNEIANQAILSTLPPTNFPTAQPQQVIPNNGWRNGEPAKPGRGEWETRVAISPAPRFTISKFLGPQTLFPLWLGGSIIVFAWTIWHTYRFQRLLRFARPAPKEMQNQVQQLAGRLGLKRCPVLYLLPGAVSPMIWTLGRAPRLLFPARLLERLDRDQRAALFVHELAHLTRRDHWVRFLELIVLTLYWWHPVVWWARRELHEAEEQCCDAWVVWALSGQSRAYALALLHTVDFFSHARPTLPLAASGIGQVPHLRRRLTMIMQERTPRSLTWAGCVAVLALGLLLPLAPVLGQDGNKNQKGGQSDKDGRDRQIEALKMAIQILEEQKRTDQQGDLKALNADLKNKEHLVEVRKATAEVDQLTKEVEKQRKVLKAVEAKLQAAKQHLNKLAPQGKQSNALELKPVEIQWTSPHISEANLPYAWRYDTIVVPQNYHTDVPLQYSTIYTNQPSNSPHQPAGQDKKEELEKKVDKLLKEVEELKRELQKHKQASPQKN